MSTLAVTAAPAAMPSTFLPIRVFSSISPRSSATASFSSRRSSASSCLISGDSGILQLFSRDLGLFDGLFGERVRGLAHERDTDGSQPDRDEQHRAAHHEKGPPDRED